MISGTSAILIVTFPVHKLSVSNYVFRGHGEGGREIEQKGLWWADFRKCIESTTVCMETIGRCDTACWASCTLFLASLYCSFESGNPSVFGKFMTIFPLFPKHRKFLNY